MPCPDDHCHGWTTKVASTEVLTRAGGDCFKHLDQGTTPLQRSRWSQQLVQQTSECEIVHETPLAACSSGGNGSDL